MSGKIVENSNVTGSNCLCALSKALEEVEIVVAERIENKMSAGRISAVARELKELMKVVAVCGY